MPLMLIFFNSEDSPKNTYDDNDYFNEFYRRK